MNLKKIAASMSRKKKIIICIIAAAVVCGLIAAVALRKNAGKARYKLLLDWDFSEGIGEFGTDAYVKNTTVFTVASGEGVDGSACAKIYSDTPNDARFTWDLEVKPNTYYKVTATVRTEHVVSSGKQAGANISSLKSYEYGGELLGDNDWTEVTVYGLTSSDQKLLTLCLRLGFYSGDTTGTAWFDNIKVEQLTSLPDGARAISFERSMEKNQNSSSSVTPSQSTIISKHDDGMKIGAIITVLALLYFAVMYRYARVRDKEFAEGRIKRQGGVPKALIAMLGAALVLRLVLSVTGIQCSIDVNLFRSWGKHIVHDGIPNFYANASSYSLDYPPLYMYFLWFNTLLAKWLNVTDTAAATMLIKLPSILSDVAIGFLLYRFTENKISKNWSMFIAALWLFNPVVLIDAALWGQVDSILALFCLLMVYFITRDKFIPASVMLGLAIILKPQGIFMLPIMGFALLRRLIRKKDAPKLQTVLLMLKCVCVCAVTIFLVALPFGIKMEPDIFTWLINLYIGTAGGYTGATVNSYNFYYVIGQNWTNDSTAWMGLTYFKWGMIFIVISCLIAGAEYLLSKRDDAAMPFTVSAAMVYMVTMFGPRMHERYFFPCVALLLAAVIYSNNKILLYIFGLLSSVNFLSVLSIMLGLEVGGELRNAGASSDIYGKYYWAAQVPYRQWIAGLNLFCCIALLTVSVLIAFNVIKDTPKLRIWTVRENDPDGEDADAGDVDNGGSGEGTMPDKAPDHPAAEEVNA